jgi:hypothetical protein
MHQTHDRTICVTDGTELDTSTMQQQSRAHTPTKRELQRAQTSGVCGTEGTDELREFAESGLEKMAQDVGLLSDTQYSPSTSCVIS